MDENLFYVIDNWEKLSWLDKKHLCWISFWSQYRVGPRKIVTGLVFLSAIGVEILEHHTYHKIVLFAFLALFYFYAMMLNYYYEQRLRHLSR